MSDAYQLYWINLQTPPLQGPVGVAFGRGFIKHIDDLNQDTIDSVKARFPTIAAANGDTYALGLKGEERRLRRYPSETDEEYGARLKNAWEIYSKAGTETAIIEDLEGLRVFRHHRC